MATDSKATIERGELFSAYLEQAEFIEENGYDEGECEQCGEPYCLEPDGQGACSECGAPIQSLYIRLGLI